MNYRILIAFLCVLFAGCANSWKQANQKDLDKEMLNKALKECDFEGQRKLAQLYIAGSHSGDDAYNERMRNTGDKTYQDALLCMKNKGFTK